MPVPIALVLAAFFQTQPAPAPPTHDRDPWVFRCVLDDNPRMLIISLGDHWWMAFDTVHCSIYKVWQGEIELTGAVYDTKHGPQPHAKGRFVLDGKSPIRFLVGKDDSSARWGGYRLQGEVATLNWQQNHVTFKLTPRHDGQSLKLEIEHTPINEEADLAVNLPNWLALIPDSIDPKVDRDGGGPVDAVETFAVPKTGSLTITLPLADNQEPKK